MVSFVVGRWGTERVLSAIGRHGVGTGTRRGGGEIEVWTFRAMGGGGWSSADGARGMGGPATHWASV
jgi:hypothetical protein